MEILYLPVVPLHSQHGYHICSSCKHKNMNIHISFTMWHCLKLFSFLYQPDLVMYFVVRAALERKLSTCSTSSPTVFPAPSWLLPPYFTCSESETIRSRYLVLYYHFLYCTSLVNISIRSNFRKLKCSEIDLCFELQCHNCSYLKLFQSLFLQCGYIY